MVGTIRYSAILQFAEYLGFSRILRFCRYSKFGFRSVSIVVIEDTFSEELAMVLGDVVTKFDVTVSVMGMLAWVVECVDNVARMIVDGEVLIDCADKLAFGCLLSTESGCVLYRTPHHFDCDLS